MTAARKLRLALIGTESLRAKEIKTVLSVKKFPLESVDFFDADVREEYSKLTSFRDEPKVIRALDIDSLREKDLVFLASDDATNRKIGGMAKNGEFLAVDLNETFNMESGIPLVVAGVNDGGLGGGKAMLIANPHPATIFLCQLYHALDPAFGIGKSVAFVLQPASSFEEEGIQELFDQSLALLNGASVPKKIFKDQAAFNLLVRTERPDKNGFSPKENQIMREVGRVFGGRSDGPSRGPGFSFSLSVIQAPVFHTYSIMAYVEFKRAVEVQDLNGAFRDNPVFQLSPEEASKPVSSISAAGRDKIFVGPVKKAAGISKGFWIWLSADNLTMGSALNAFGIAKSIFRV